MFDDALLDSSPARAPVLARIHYLLAAAAGALGFLAALRLLPYVFPVAQTKALLLPGGIFGAALMFYALMLCYVYADARHLRLGVVAWFAATLILNLAGFIAYLIYSAARTGNWKRATVPIAYMLQILLVGALVLWPLIHMEALPKMTLIVDGPPPPPPPPAPARSLTTKAPPHRVNTARLLEVPPRIPPTIQQFVDEPLTSENPPDQGVGVPGGVEGGVPNGIINSIGQSIMTTPPPPPVPAKRSQPERIRLGGQVVAAKAIYQPKPDYPPLARMARIQGTVQLEAVIGKDGTVRELKVVSGHPMLVNAALEAVKQWRYQPTLLNTEPVEVLTEINVTFTLAE